MDTQEYIQNLRDDFRFFLKEVWCLKPDEQLPEPHWMQYDMADWLQNGPHRRGLRGKRGISKTWITTAFVLWNLFKNPSCKVVLVSANPTNSKKTLHMMRRWIDNIPFLAHLAPKPPKAWRDAAEMFDVGTCSPTRDPSVSAMGILGALPGTRANLIIADDVETPENTLTIDARNRLEYRCEELEHILLERGDSIYLGTDHHETSLYEKLLEGKGYAFRSWPIAYPTPEETKLIPDLAPSITHRIGKGLNKPGDPTWRERFDKAYIDDLRISAPATFHMQHMLMRGLADEELYSLKLSDLVMFESMQRDEAPMSLAWGRRDNNNISTAVEDISSVGFGADCYHRAIRISDEWSKYHGTKAFLDPAPGGKKNPDEIGFSIVSQLHGYLYAKHSDGMHGGAHRENLMRVVLALRKHGATELCIEENNGGKYVAQLIEPIIREMTLAPGECDLYPEGWACSVSTQHSSTAKEWRILDALESVVGHHRLVVSRAVAEDKTLMYQFTRIRRIRGCLEHDDRLDALAGAVSLFLERLRQDSDDLLKQSKEKAYLKRLDELRKANDRFYTPVNRGKSCLVHRN